MPAHLRLRLATLCAALWWGSLTALCAVVVPLLFVHLPSAQLAGSMAARLFAAQSWISALCGLFLLMVFNRADDQTLIAVGRAVLRWVVAGILLALLIEWGIAPRILAARLDGQSLRLWHSLGSGMLLAQWLCVCALMWRLSCRP